MTSIQDLYNNTKELSVLFVEDDEILLKQMLNILQELFHDVSTASNGKLGLANFKTKLEEDNNPYDLVITDINMPVMNGIDMIKEIYQLAPSQHIIVTSAYNDSHYLIDLLNLGVSGFLIKPINSANINKTLYTVSQAINNEALIKSHYTTIERLNKQLSVQSQELEDTNNELHEKNIALEESMRIIEGMRYKEHTNNTQNNNLDVYSDVDLDFSLINETSLSTISQSTKCLKNIESIVSNLALKYNKNETGNQLLDELSNAILSYIISLPKKDIYRNLKQALQNLSDTTAKHPKSTKEEDLNLIFNMLKSFFYIYTKWQNECSNIEDKQFNIYSRKFETEVDTIVKIWNGNNI